MRFPPRPGCIAGPVPWLGLLLIAACWLGSPRLANGQFTRAPTRDDRHIVSRHVWTWEELKKRNVVMQEREYSCGAAALATVMRYLWDDRQVTEDSLLAKVDKILTQEEIKDRIENGLSLTDLEKVALDSGYDAAKLKGTISDLAQSKVPVIVGITVRDYDHFVVVRGIVGPWVYLADPMRGNLRVGIGTFQQQWQQNAMLVVVKSGVTDLPTSSPLSVRYGEASLGRLNDQALQHAGLRPIAVPP
jgi:predicted double-glycine peptidase